MSDDDKGADEAGSGIGSAIDQAKGRVKEAAGDLTGDKDLLEWLDQHPPVLTPSAFDRLIGE